MQPTCDLPSEQHLHARLNSFGVFNRITDNRFDDTVEPHLAAHRERTYPLTDTLEMFVAQDLNDGSSSQRAVYDRIIRCLQHGRRHRELRQRPIVGHAPVHLFRWWQRSSKRLSDKSVRTPSPSGSGSGVLSISIVLYLDIM